MMVLFYLTYFLYFDWRLFVRKYKLNFFQSEIYKYINYGY